MSKVSTFEWMTPEEFLATVHRVGDVVVVEYENGGTRALVDNGCSWYGGASRYAIIRPPRPAVGTMDAIAHVLGGGTAGSASNGRVISAAPDGSIIGSDGSLVVLCNKFMSDRWHLGGD